MLRKVIFLTVAVYAAAVASAAVVRDIPYASENGKFGLGDLYLPEKSSPETPVVLVGDFNCRENEEPILAVAEKMTNALYASETPPTGPWRSRCGSSTWTAGSFPA